MTVQVFGAVRESGGAMFVLAGADPYVMVHWTLTGNGSLTPIDDYTNYNGVAVACWDAGGAAAGESITVTAYTHA